MGRAPTAIFALAAMLAAVAGCGGGATTGTDGGPDAEAQINQVLEDVFAGSDPSQCAEVTPGFLEQVSPESAKSGDPIAACREAVSPEAAADSIEVTDISVDGTTASASVSADGGSFAGAKVGVSLVDDGGWQIDRIESVGIVDRGAYLSSIDKRATAGLGDKTIKPQEARCVADQIGRNASNAELERSITRGERDFIFEAINECIGGGADLATITILTTRQLADAGLTQKQADCVAGGGIAGLGKGFTLQTFAEDPQMEAKYERALKAAAPACG